MTWTFKGFVRIHFNKKEEWPLLASFTDREHNWEMLAKSVDIRPGVALSSDHDLVKSRPGLDPIWWLHGIVEIEISDEGHAVVRPHPLQVHPTIPCGIMSGLAIDESAGRSVGFATALGPIEGLSPYIPNVTKKRKTRKKSQKRRVHKSR